MTKSEFGLIIGTVQHAGWARDLVIQARCLMIEGCINNGPQPKERKASPGKARKTEQIWRVRQNVCMFMSVCMRVHMPGYVHVARDFAQPLNMTDKYSTTDL